MLCLELRGASVNAVQRFLGLSPPRHWQPSCRAAYASGTTLNPWRGRRDADAGHRQEAVSLSTGQVLAPDLRVLATSR